MKCIAKCASVLIVLLTVAIVGGCAASRDMNRIVQSAGDFTLERIENQGAGVECIATDTTMSNIIGEYRPDLCLVASYTRGNAAYQAGFVSFEGDYGAAGAYSVLRPENATSFDISYEGRRTANSVQFVKGNYMVNITPRQNGTIDGAEDLAKQLSARISRGILLSPFKTLVTENLIEDSRLYFMGPLGLGTRYPRNLVEALMVNRDMDGIAARYMVDMWEVDFLELEYPDYVTAREALNSYLRSFSGGPLVYPDAMLQYYTIVVPDRSEVYIAQYDNTVYIMFGNPSGGQTKPFFEYILRSTNQTTPNT